MITVINNFNENVEMYEGMSLADASAQFMLEANQLVNDFMMDLLMTEHQYLYDHGEQIDWTQEAADGGLSFMDKVSNLISNAKNLFLKIVNNIIAFVQEKTSQVINWFKKIGLTKSNIRNAFAKNQDEKVDISNSLLNLNNYLDLVGSVADQHFVTASDIDSKADNLFTSAGELIDAIEDKGYYEDQTKSAKEIPVDNIINIIFSSDKLISFVKKIYKKATDSLEKAKKKFAAKKSMDSSDIKEKLDNLRAGVLNNTYIMRDFVKIIGNLVKEAISIARDLVKTEKNKDKDDKKKEKEDANKPDNDQTDEPKDDKTENSKEDEVKTESTYLDDAIDYLQGCLEGTYEIDEELLEACVNIVNENTSTITVDDYNTVMESVEYLSEATKEEKAARIDKKLAKLDAKDPANNKRFLAKYEKVGKALIDSKPGPKQLRLLKKIDKLDAKGDKMVEKLEAKKAKLEAKKKKFLSDDDE